MYLCQFVFSASALHFLVRWISRLIALWSKGVYIPSLHFFCENNPEPWPVFFSSIGKWSLKTSFSITIMGSYTSENNCSGQWRRKSTGHMYSINGLPDLASYGSPLFPEPLSVFGCALCNTSTYCMLTLWLSCVNYAQRGEFPFLPRLLQDIFTYALFWLPRVFPLNSSFPIILFRFLETNVCWNQSSCARNVPLTLSL